MEDIGYASDARKESREGALYEMDSAIEQLEKVISDPHSRMSHVLVDEGQIPIAAVRESVATTAVRERTIRIESSIGRIESILRRLDI